MEKLYAPRRGEVRYSAPVGLRAQLTGNGMSSFMDLMSDDGHDDRIAFLKTL
jgi:hypothetical protein